MPLELNRDTAKAVCYLVRGATNTLNLNHPQGHDWGTAPLLAYEGQAAQAATIAGALATWSVGPQATDAALAGRPKVRFRITHDDRLVVAGEGLARTGWQGFATD